MLTAPAQAAISKVRGVAVVDMQKVLNDTKQGQAARKKLEEQTAKSKEPLKPLPEFGGAEDFPLAQALNQLKGQPVAVSKTHTVRKAELSSDKQ